MEQKPKIKETKVKHLIWDEKQANCLFRAIVAYFEYATFALDLIIVRRHMAKKVDELSIDMSYYVR